MSAAIERDGADPDPHWRRGATCVEEDPELFFAVGTSGPALVQIAEAKAVCARCPVTAECLGWALASGQDSGVWGGLTDAERRDLRARRAASGRQRAAAGSRRTRPCSGPYER